MNFLSKKVALLICSFLFIISYTQATVYTTVSSGKWTSNQNWDSNGAPGTYWGTGDQVIVNHNMNLNQNLGFAGSLTVQNNGTLDGSNKSIDLYNGANFTFNGAVDIKQLTLNSTSNVTHTAPLTLKNHLNIGAGSNLNSMAEVEVGNHFNNNGGTVVFNQNVTINGNLTNNNGQIDFLDNALVDGNIQNNNSSAVINIEDNFTSNGNLQNNSGATVNIGDASSTTIDGNFTNNSGSHLAISGRLNSNSKFDNNGGTVENNGIFDGQGKLTQNGGVFTNNGVMLVHDEVRVNGNGTIDGTGLLRTNTITNYGSITGDNDVCALDDSSMPSQTGGGDYSSGTTYCQESASEALPIVLDYFRVESSAGSIHFFWKTLAEINNDFFTIEFSSDGKSFEPLLTNQGAGNSNQAIIYERSIVNPKSQNGYFRLKQTDFDSKYSYSEIVYNKFENELPQVVNAYPNPNDGSRLFIELKNLKAHQYTIGILNSKGALIKQKDILIEADAFYFETELLHGISLKPDLYYVRISSESERFLKKLVVK
jgi:hypothetical protein